MKLKKISIRNLAGLPDRAFSFLDKDGAVRAVTVVTGESRSGKTSLLRAITAAKEAVGAYGAAPHPMNLVRPLGDARISATWGLSEAEQAAAREPEDVTVEWELSTGELPEVSPGLRAIFSRFTLDSERSKMELVPARRGFDVALETPLSPAFPEEQEGRARLRPTLAKYAGAMRAMHEGVLNDSSRTVALLDERGHAFRRDLPDSLARYKVAVGTLCPSVRLVAVEPRERTRPLVWFQTKTGARVELLDLSDSEHQGFLFACAFTWLGLKRAIVLVDTPELHIHPAEHARFFRGICELGAGSQIIAASTSPAILDSVAPEQIIDLSHPGSAE